MADQLDSGREAAAAARPPRIAPITGRPGQTAGESVASALRPRKRVTVPAASPEPTAPTAPPVPLATAEDADQPGSTNSTNSTGSPDGPDRGDLLDGDGQPHNGTATRATEDSDDI